MNGDPLGSKVVIDRLGSLFNKEAILNHLLEHRTDTFKHIRSLKDVSEPKFTINPNHQDQNTGELENLLPQCITLEVD
jgi:hypothetical protein